MPTITLTRFDRNFKTNNYFDVGTYPTRLTFSGYAIDDYMNDCIKLQSADSTQPAYWTCAEYQGKKRQIKSNIKHNTAIILEYHATERSALDAALKSRGYEYILVETDCKNHNKVAAIIPLNAPIPIIKSYGYTRLVSLLVNNLNIYNLTHGVDAETFLIRPIANRTVTYVAGNPLDWAAVIRRGAGQIVVTAKYVNPKPATPGLSPSLAASGPLPPPGSNTAAAVIARVSDDGLWEGL